MINLQFPQPVAVDRAPGASEISSPVFKGGEALMIANAVTIGH